MACFPCKNPGCQGFCNVHTRNQFGKVIHTEQGSQKAPWKSSRVTPSSKRHRRRLAGCTTVKPGLAVWDLFLLLGPHAYQRCKPEEDVSTLPYSIGLRSDLADNGSRVCLKS